MDNKDGQIGTKEKWTATAVYSIIMLVSVVMIVRYFLMNELTIAVVMFVIHVLIMLAGYIAMKSRCYLLDLIIGGFSIVLGTTNTFSEINIWVVLYFVMATAGILGGIICYYFRVKEKGKLRKMSVVPILAFVLMGALAGTIWAVQTHNAKTSQERALRSVWAVPNKYNDVSCLERGTVTKLFYETKAYATDERIVQKACNVYVPYGYDASKEYNILYLMHGTGDDENYWLIEHSNNKVMLDNMIYSGEIEPMIVVTPTWYVEDDCSEDLDQLTYSFAKELRNELMPLVESTYTTYAETIDDAGFSESREHRAFAGLSRGSVTMFHAAMQENLDAFAWFGGFSASRIDMNEWANTAMADEFGEYPISYLYVTTGTSDLAAERQLREYSELLALDDRLIEGENTSFDVFPMRYHSAGAWHLSLYNFVQKIFQ